VRLRLDDVGEFANLLDAHLLARRGKRDRDEVARFSFDAEAELLRLRDELRTRSYAPSPYRTFVVHDPKTRVIHAAPYRDRVVHHALCRVIEPALDRTFIFDSYACRVGKGQHRALDRFAFFARRFAYAAHLDVRKFFPSIDHGVLMVRLTRRLRDDGIIWLCHTILDGGIVAAGRPWHFPGDDLYAPIERARGLPIGNLTSQVFANTYLDAVDHFVKEELRVGGYVRYMDDMALLDDSPRALRENVARVRDFLLTLRLRIHENRAIPQATRAGVTFLGVRIFAGVGARSDHRRILGRVVRRVRKRLHRRVGEHLRGEIDLGQLRACVQATLEHLSHADAEGLTRSLLREIDSALGGRALLLPSPSG
jgi:retron-type reverse transcriptase